MWYVCSCGMFVHVVCLYMWYVCSFGNVNVWYTVHCFPDVLSSQTARSFLSYIYLCYRAGPRKLVEYAYRLQIVISTKEFLTRQ